MPSPEPPSPESLRPHIARSWQRVMAVGLDPGARLEPVPVPVDLNTALLRAARPVLDDLAEHLQDTAYAVILADHDARLVDIRCGVRSLATGLERLGAVLGARFTESTTGTSSIATAYEEGGAVAVLGDEHYLESLKDFACYGVPVRSPLTRRIAGVLDITCRAKDANNLLGPFLVRAAREVECRMSEDARRTHRHILAAFDAARSRSAGPLVAFGPDIVLANRSAADLLQPADQAMLQTLQPDPLDGVGMPRTVRLTSGRSVHATVTAIEGAVLVALRPAERAAPIPRARHREQVDGTADWHHALRSDLQRYREAGTSVLISGEAGTGRSTVAGYLGREPGDHGRSDTGRLVVVEGAGASRSDIDAVFDAAPEALVLEHADLLDLRLAARFAQRWSSLGSGCRLIITSGPEGLPAGEWASLAALCPARVVLPPLRAARDRIPAFAEALLRERTEGRARFTTGVLRTLAASDWPGNLTQLRTLIEYVALRRTAGDIIERDLPPDHREMTGFAVSGTLWQAERDAIVRALRECGGNKVHAARRLGISRNALYRRLRILKVDPAVGLLGESTVPKPHT